MPAGLRPCTPPSRRASTTSSSSAVAGTASAADTIPSETQGVWGGLIEPSGQGQPPSGGSLAFLRLREFRALGGRADRAGERSAACLPADSLTPSSARL